MLKRERERVQGKPSSSESVSDRRIKENLSRKSISRENSWSHEVSSEQPSQTHEVRDVDGFWCF